MKNAKQLKFIDLFCGIGGFRLGFESAGFKCVFSSDNDKYAQETYAKNFGEIPYGDITKIDPVKDLPDFDILLGGFPCQPFSISGKKLGFEDTRGTLFFYICKIIKAKNPSVVVLENVKHLIHHDKGRTIKVILNTLKDLGYMINMKLLNAKDFGVPQNRERVFIVATRGRYFDFNQMQTQPTPKLKDFLETNGDFEFLNKNEYTLIDEPKVQRDSGLKFVGYRNKNGWKKGVRPNTQHLSRVHRQPNRIYSVDGVHPTIPSQETAGRFFIYIPKLKAVRKLTLKECYKIMGFPTNYKIHEATGPAYKQVGNSVCVPVIEALANTIKNQEVWKSGPQTEAVRDLQILLFN